MVSVSRPTAAAMIGFHPSPPAATTSDSFRELDDVFLQTQTRIWLEEVLHTRLDDQLKICDLLSDGELLFEVSKVLWNMLLSKLMELKHVKAHTYIRVGSRKSSGRYRPYCNVDSFLKICKVLGLNGIDVFSPSDVVEKRDTRKVCICVRSLSKKARSKQLNVPDFDIVTNTVAMPSDIVRCIRRSLELSRSSPASSSPSGRKYGRSKCRQKKSVTLCEQNGVSCVEDSNEVISNPMEKSASSCKDLSCVDAQHVDLERSPGVQFAIKRNALEGVLHSSKQGRHMFVHLPGSAESIFFQYDIYNCQLESISSFVSRSPVILSDSDTNVKNDLKLKHEIEAADSVDVNFAEDNSDMTCISHLLEFSDRVAFGSGDSDHLLDAEDSLLNSFQDVESCGSNSTQRSSNFGIWRSFSDDANELEESSNITRICSMSSCSLNFDLDSGCEADDLHTTKSLKFDVDFDKADRLVKEVPPDQNFDLDVECNAGYYNLTKSLRNDLDYYEAESHVIGPRKYLGSHFVKGPDISECTGNSPLSYCDDFDLHTSACQDIIPLNNQIGPTQRVSTDSFCMKCTDLSCTNNKFPVKKKCSDEVFICPAVFDSGPNRHHATDGYGNRRVEYSNDDSAATFTSLALEASETCHNGSQDCSSQHEFYTGSYSCLVGSCPGGMYEEFDYPSLYHLEDDHYCDDHTNKVALKGESKEQDLCCLSEDNTVDKNYQGAGKPENKPAQGAHLLKSVVKGTALVGLLLWVHLSRSRGDRDKQRKGGENSRQIQKLTGMEFSSQKAETGINIYPSEKLQFGN